MVPVLYSWFYYFKMITLALLERSVTPSAGKLGCLAHDATSELKQVIFVGDITQNVVLLLLHKL